MAVAVAVAVAVCFVYIFSSEFFVFSLNVDLYQGQS